MSLKCNHFYGLSWHQVTWISHKWFFVFLHGQDTHPLYRHTERQTDTLKHEQTSLKTVPTLHTERQTDTLKHEQTSLKTVPALHSIAGAQWIEGHITAVCGSIWAHRWFLRDSVDYVQVPSISVGICDAGTTRATLTKTTSGLQFAIKLSYS